MVVNLRMRSLWVQDDEQSMSFWSVGVDDRRCFEDVIVYVHGIAPLLSSKMHTSCTKCTRSVSESSCRQAGNRT